MRSKHRCSTAILAALLISGTCSVSVAQNAGPTREQSSAARAFARTVGAAATQDAKLALAAVIKAELDQFQVTNAKTFADAEKMAKFADMRTRLDSTWISGCRNPEASKVAAYVVAFYATKMLAQDISPQSKINCMALLAELDEAPASGGNPPTPSAQAEGILFDYLGNDKQPTYLRAIALAGAQRHLGRWWSDAAHWKDDKKRGFAAKFVAIVNSEPKSELEVRSHAWLVSRAYDCLATTGSPAGAAKALDHLADGKALPSVRISALKYLSHLDVTSWPEDKKMQYFIGLAQFTRNQLFDWYEYEEDQLKAKSGAGAGGMMGGSYGGDGGMGYGGGYPGGSEGGYPGGSGGGYPGGSEGGYPGAGGMGGSAYGGEGGGYGGYGGAMGAARRPKPIDTQTWQVRLARRLINQVTQAARVALDGAPLAEAGVDPTVKPLKDANYPEDVKALVIELTEVLDGLQTAVNDPLLVTNMDSLQRQAETRIEEIMELVKRIPGFLERYPELAEDDGLDSVEEMQAAPPAEQGSEPAGASEPGTGEPGTGEPAGTSEPATDDPAAAAAPADDTTAANP